MTLNNRGLRVGTAVIAVALAATACGGSSSKKGDTTTTGAKGGQLVVLNNADFTHFDPQRNYVSSDLNFGRLVYRTLTTYKSQAGAAGTEIVPDLATNLGVPSDGAKTWTFTLKEGLKYEDGTEIKASDVKYGVERSMSPLIDSGPQYAKQYLIGGTAYKGPYSGADLPSIVADDAKRTIVFKLKSAHGDFGYTVSLPTFSPVPKAKDTKVNYDLRPISSGPYKIDTYARGKSMTLSRNTNWGQDDVRKALPDTIKVVMGLEAPVIDGRLIASVGDDANAVSLDTSLQAADLVKLNDASVKKRSVEGTTGFLRYIAMNTTKGPTAKLAVRKAVQYAMNKVDYQTARGGPKAAGDIATTILAPTVQGHADFDPFKQGDTGDPAKAKQMLAAAGYPNGFTATLETTANTKGNDTAQAFQAAMKRAGITIKIAAVDGAVYYSTIGDIKKEPEFVIAAWGPDWPAASTVIPPLFDGRQIVPTGNQNFAQLNDPAVNAEMDRIAALTDSKAANEAWGKLDEKILVDDSPIIPILNDKAVFLFGSNVKGAFLHGFYGEPDIAALGVK